MPDEATIGELFELGIAAEEAAEKLYRGLEKLFAHHPEITRFWARYAAEEAGHGRQLQQFRDQATPEQLSTPIDPSLIHGLRSLFQSMTAETLRRIQNLDEAYELANELEHSEINSVFEFLISHCSADEKVQAFLKSLLQDHISRLMFEFPVQFRNAEKRQEVQALQQTDPSSERGGTTAPTA